MDLTRLFTNRELALFIWALIAIPVLLIMAKGVIQPLLGMAKIIFASRMTIFIVLLLLYVCTIIFIFYKLFLWDATLLKATVFWFFGNAVVLFFRKGNEKDIKFFSDMAKKSIKWTIALEFIVNFYCFDLWVELLMIPSILFFVLLQYTARSDKKYASVNKLLSNFTSFIAITFLLFVLYKTVAHYTEIFTYENLKELLLSPVLTLLFLPFLYSVSLYSTYEQLFFRLRFIEKDGQRRKQIRKQVFLIANIKLGRLSRISKKIVSEEFYETTDIEKYLRTIAATP